MSQNDDRFNPIKDHPNSLAHMPGSYPTEDAGVPNVEDLSTDRTLETTMGGEIAGDDDVPLGALANISL